MDEHLLRGLGESGVGALTTLKRDGRPQLSMVGYQYVPAEHLVRISVTDDRAKVRNARRDPRVSMLVEGAEHAGYVVVEGTARLGEVAGAVDDAATDALVEHYRSVNGEHQDWSEFRQAMVNDRRLLLTLTVEHAYGWLPG